MDFSLLDTFITVVHAGSIRKTADLMNTSASGLYRRLDQLENRQVSYCLKAINLH